MHKILLVLGRNTPCFVLQKKHQQAYNNSIFCLTSKEKSMIITVYILVWYAFCY